MEQVYTPKQDYKVLVRCFTYNQSKYIDDALNGFAMQKTDFPFVCLVMDDASTDGEQEVIKAWMTRECDMEKVENVEIEKSFVTIVPHKTNPSCTFAFYFLKENLYKKGGKMPMVNPWREHCEYEALCEGDDYWIHPGKLQMQFSFLEEHPLHAMCFHAHILRYQNGDQKTIHKYDGTITYVPVEDVFNKSGKGMFSATCSLMYRLNFIKDYPSWAFSAPVGDRPLKMILYSRGQFGYIDEVMSVYNLGTEGSWTSRINYSKDLRVKKQFYKGMNKIYIDYDEWTNRKYHKILMQRLREDRIFQFISISKIRIARVLGLLGIKK